MAESSKKQPRKSKIVLRECVDVEDDENDSSEMQIATENQHVKSLLPKLKTAMLTESYLDNSPSPVHFSIQVDVESCEEDDDDQSNQEICYEEVIISNEAIGNEIAKLSSHSSYSNRILLLEYHNLLGNMPRVPYEPDYYEKLIQDVMYSWRIWNMSSPKIRTTILAYRCNICSVGWWYLQPFWDHIKIHKELRLSLDTFNHECCLVANQGEWYDYESMCLSKIEGNCPKCLRSYEDHYLARKGTQFYFCKGCHCKVATCLALFEHEGQCIGHEKLLFQSTILTEDKWRCRICDIKCLTEERYNQHYTNYHSVRSDMPVTTSLLKVCNFCKCVYHSYNLHACTNKVAKIKCDYCCRSFVRKELAKIHVDNTKKAFNCKICKRYLGPQCLEMEHLLKYHNKKFCLVHKCNQCLDNVLLYNKTGMKNHQKDWHCNRKSWDRFDINRFPREMIVPRSCMTSRWSGGDRVAEMVIDTVQKPKRSSAAGSSVDKPDEESPLVIDHVAKKFQHDKEIMDDNNEMKRLCADLRIGIVKRKKNRLINTGPNMNHQHLEPTLTAQELLTAVESLKNVDTNRANGGDIDDLAEGIDDNLDDDDAIMEAQSSVDAILSNVIIKDEVIIEEPVWDCIVIQDSDEEEYMGETINKDSVKQEKLPVIKQKPVSVDENYLKENVNNKVRKEIDEESNREVKFDLAIVKKEPETIDDNLAKKKDVDVKTNLNENKDIKTEISVKQESADRNSDDDDIEKEENACLAELSKLLKTTKDSEIVESTGISVSKEVDIKEEMIDYEDDMIVLYYDTPTFDMKSNKEQSDIISADRSMSDESKDLSSEADLNQFEHDVEYPIEPGVPFRRLLTHKGEVIRHSTSRKKYRCNKCGYTAVHREYQRHVASVCKRRKHKKKREKPAEWLDIRCTKCNTEYDNLRNYFYHFTKHDFKKGACPKCGRIFMNPHKVTQHLTSHIRSSFLRVQLLKESACLSWKKDGLYECKVCRRNVEFSGFFSHWEQHFDPATAARQAADAPYSAPAPSTAPASAPATSTQNEFDYTYTPTQVKKLVDQLKDPTTHSPRDAVDKVCVHCGHMFGRRNDLKRHVVEHLLRHARANAETHFTCQLCSVAIDKPAAFKIHLRNHASMPVFRCEMCDKCFSDSSNFAKHKKIHNLHGILRCDTCNKKFNSKIQLEKHIKMHRLTDPIRCELCNRLFFSESAYKKHNRSRHEKRPLDKLCSMCTERFQSMRSLWNHMWEAHKRRRIKADCPICNQSFRKYYDVRKHLKEVHDGVLEISRGAGFGGVTYATVAYEVSFPSTKRVRGDSKSVGGRSKGVGEGSKGVGGGSKGVGGASKGVSGGSKGVGGASKGVSGGSKGNRNNAQIGDVESFLSSTSEVTLADVID